MSTPLQHILLVEDNEDHAFLILRHLKQQAHQFRFTRAGTLKQAREFLSQNSVHAVLLDLFLPDSNGLDTLKSILKFDQKIPVIVLTSLNDDKIAMEALQKGAQDFINKDEMTTSSLLRSIHYSIERKKTELELLAHRELLNAIIDNSQSVIFVKDLEGQYTLVNKHFERIFDKTRKDVLGKTDYELFPEKYAEAFHRLDKEVLLGNRPVLSETMAPQADGIHTYLSSRFPIRDVHGVISSIGGISTDITAMKLVERQLERYATELKRSNRELERFAYVASHDLKTPIRGIENLAYWIEEDAGEALPESAKNHLERLQNRVKRLDALLDNLLEFSRIGRFNHEPEELNLAMVVDETLELLAPPDTFKIEIVCDDISFRIPRVPLETILRNLIGNAIKHHHRQDGAVTLTIRDATHSLEIEVSDDGPGISEAFHDRIFQIFQTLKPRDEVEGSGMGLAIVKKFAEYYGGEITLESSEGRGSTFRFTFPATPVTVSIPD